MNVAPWIQTYTGRRWNLLGPRSDDVDPDDLARALSNLCRFGGHVRKFYSVAEHLVRCHDFLEARSAPPALCLAGLLHDAHEAYLGDIVSPLKMAGEALLAGTAGAQALRALQRSHDEAIAAWAGIGADTFETPEVDFADRSLLATERRDLLAPPPAPWCELPPPFAWEIVPRNPDEARQEFHDRLRLYRGWRA